MSGRRADDDGVVVVVAYLWMASGSFMSGGKMGSGKTKRGETDSPARNGDERDAS